MKHAFAAVALVVLAAAVTPAGQGLAPQAEPDMATSEGFLRTCAALRTRFPTGNAQRQAAATCRDVALVQHVMTFLRHAREVEFGRRMKPEQVTAHIRAELTHLRGQLRATRDLLTSIQLQPGDGLVLVPAQWQVDLDSDGTVDVWERNFFAIPVRQGDSPMLLREPSDDIGYYEAQYNLAARIRVDQTDIAWALSYHQFLESLVETVLAYTARYEGHDLEVVLIDRAALLRARQLLLAGLATSGRVRQLALAETDDQDEWLPNPRQRHSVFPMPLDAQDYAIWQSVVPGVARLVEGAALLPGDSQARGLWGSLARLCPDGTGLNVSKAYTRPASELVYLEEALPGLGWCDVIGPEHPASDLMPLISQYAARMESDRVSGTNFLKYLLWVN